MTTAPLLYSGNKDIKEIQQIVTSTKAANLANCAVWAIANLTMMAKRKQLERSNLRQNEECFNYKRKGHYAKDCHNFTCNVTKRKSVKSLQKKLNEVDGRKIRPKPPNRQQTMTTLMQNLIQPVELS